MKYLFLNFSENIRTKTIAQKNKANSEQSHASNKETSLADKFKKNSLDSHVERNKLVWNRILLLFANTWVTSSYIGRNSEISIFILVTSVVGKMQSLYIHLIKRKESVVSNTITLRALKFLKFKYKHLHPLNKN